MPPHVLMSFRGFHPGCGDSEADFWGMDAHEARLHDPDDVSGDMQEDEIPGGALSLNLLTTQTMFTTGIFPCKEKIPMVEPGIEPGTSWLRSQSPWPLDLVFIYLCTLMKLQTVLYSYYVRYDFVT